MLYVTISPELKRSGRSGSSKIRLLKPQEDPETIRFSKLPPKDQIRHKGCGEERRGGEGTEERGEEAIPSCQAAFKQYTEV